MIPIHKQDDPHPPYEHCCFCDKPTMMWTTLPTRTPGQQVACCEGCSKTHEPGEVPSKHDWCESERKRHPTIANARYTFHEATSVAGQVTKRRRTVFNV